MPRVLLFIQSLYLGKWLFYYYGVVMFVFIFAYALPPLYWLAVFLSVLGLIVAGVDVFLLYRHAYPLSAVRLCPPVLSLSHKNHVSIRIINKTSTSYSVTVYDELPFQFQIRDQAFHSKLPASEEIKMEYQLTPKERGLYEFGSIQVYLSSILCFFQRRIKIPQEESVAVYPSIQLMKEMALLTGNKVAYQQGLKRIRRLGNNNEFDHIKQYSRGDDPRTINWKASGKRASIMVNKFEDERAQPIYCLLDTGRMMYTPFYNMSLVDYSINSILALSNVILKKHDKPGYLSFSKEIQQFVPADNRPNQIHKLLQALYAEVSTTYESDYELVYQILRRKIKRRSMIMLYTNFESIYSLQRQLEVLRKINKLHLLVVVFFMNKEMEDFAQQPIYSLEDTYQKTSTDRAVIEKRTILKTLNQYGIRAVLTYPEDLSIQTVNQYLALKARGAI